MAVIKLRVAGANHVSISCFFKSSAVTITHVHSVAWYDEHRTIHVRMACVAMHSMHDCCLFGIQRHDKERCNEHYKIRSGYTVGFFRNRYLPRKVPRKVQNKSTNHFEHIGNIPGNFEFPSFCLGTLVIRFGNFVLSKCFLQTFAGISGFVYGDFSWNFQAFVRVLNRVLVEFASTFRLVLLCVCAYPISFWFFCGYFEVFLRALLNFRVLLELLPGTSNRSGTLGHFARALLTFCPDTLCFCVGLYHGNAFLGTCQFCFGQFSGTFLGT